jgi:hypothetical protein
MARRVKGLPLRESKKCLRGVFSGGPASWGRAGIGPVAGVELPRPGGANRRGEPAERGLRGGCISAAAGPACGGSGADASRDAVFRPQGEGGG